MSKNKNVQKKFFLIIFKVLTDPALERYTPDSIIVTLIKTELGIGLSLDGGLNSRFGDRPIIVKKVFAG
jgi:hypothetical protein